MKTGQGERIMFKIIENTEQDMLNFEAENGVIYGGEIYEVTEEDLDDLRNGKLFAMGDGEYSSFVKFVSNKKGRD